MNIAVHGRARNEQSSGFIRKFFPHLADCCETLLVSEDLDEIVYMGDTMRDGSLCGLGQLAPRITTAMLRHFRSEWESHLVDKTCPAGVCGNLSGQEIVLS